MRLLQTTETKIQEMTLNELAKYETKASHAILAEECQTKEEIRQLKIEMSKRLKEMRNSIERGLSSKKPSITGMVGWNAKTLWESQDKLQSPLLLRVQSYAMAVNEENARMGKIVAAPTAGSARTLPAALIGVADHLEITDENLIEPLILAAGIGDIISKTIFIAGSSGGCQAEIGPSAAMAAAAVTELLGGNAKQAVDAAALALTNTIGLVCDPVGGYVEVPCVSRNAFYSVHAVSSAQMALAGLESVIPADEVVTAMAKVGRIMPLELRETGEGGIADTPSGRRIALRMNQESRSKN